MSTYYARILRSSRPVCRPPRTGGRQPERHTSGRIYRLL